MQLARERVKTRWMDGRKPGKVEVDKKGRGDGGDRRVPLAAGSCSNSIHCKWMEGLFFVDERCHGRLCTADGTLYLVAGSQKIR